MTGTQMTILDIQEHIDNTNQSQLSMWVFKFFPGHPSNWVLVMVNETKHDMSVKGK